MIRNYFWIESEFRINVYAVRCCAHIINLIGFIFIEKMLQCISRYWSLKYAEYYWRKERAFNYSIPKIEQNSISNNRLDCLLLTWILILAFERNTRHIFHIDTNLTNPWLNVFNSIISKNVKTDAQKKLGKIQCDTMYVSHWNWIVSH